MELFHILEKRLNTLSQFADVLQEFGGNYAIMADSLVDKGTLGSDTSSEELKDRLAEAYKTAFGTFYTLPKIGTNPSLLSLENVWVPVKLQNTTFNMETFGDYLNCLKETFSRLPVLLCKGESGSGKTMLFKKICLDWAKGSLPQYDYVLCAKLDECKPGKSLLQIALNWMCSKRFLDLKEVSKIEKFPMKFRPKTSSSSDGSVHTIVILDGLDEVKLDSFGQLREILEEQNLNLDFALLITTRPETVVHVCCAAEVARLLPLEEKQMHKMVENYSYDAIQITKVWRLLDDERIMKIAETPLLLFYICLLANFMKSAQFTKYLLLKRLCALLIKRFSCEKKIALNALTAGNWLTSALIQNLSKMAWFAIKDSKYTFSSAVLNEFQVDQDLCCQIGFLAKDEFFDPDDPFEPTVVYRFMHNVLLEFFALQHMYRSSIVQLAHITASESSSDPRLDAGEVARIAWNIWNRRREEFPWSTNLSSLCSSLMVEEKATVREKLAFTFLHKLHQDTRNPDSFESFFFSRVPLDSNLSTYFYSFITQTVKSHCSVVRLNQNLFYFPDFNVVLFSAGQKELDHFIAYRSDSDLFQVGNIDLYVAPDSVQQFLDATEQITNLLSVDKLVIFCPGEGSYELLKLSSSMKIDEMVVSVDCDRIQLAPVMNAICKSVSFVHYSVVNANCLKITCRTLAVVEDIAQALKEELFFDSIQGLVLGRVKINSEYFNKLAATIMAFSKLKGISLIGTKIGANDLLLLISCLNQKLTWLSLREEPCLQDAHVFETLCSDLSVPDNKIRWLNLSDNRLTDCHAALLLNVFPLLAGLKTVNIHNNPHISDQMRESIANYPTKSSVPALCYRKRLLPSFGEKYKGALRSFSCPTK